MAATARTFGYAAAVDRAGRLGSKRHCAGAGSARARASGQAPPAENRSNRTQEPADRAKKEGAHGGTTGSPVFLEVELDPALARGEVEELLAKAERDCFVGASLTVPPRYRWTVNGEFVTPSG
jgi:hypothetical protein